MSGCFLKKKKTRAKPFRKWRLERLAEEECQVAYEAALNAEVPHFAKKWAGLAEKPTADQIAKAVKDWEAMVHRAANSVIGKKLVVPGKATYWWSPELKEAISKRRAMHQEMLSSTGDEQLQKAYFQFRKEVKNRVRDHKYHGRQVLAEKINSSATTKPKTMWKLVKSLLGTKTSNCVTSLKTGDQEEPSTSSRAKICAIFESHYARLGDKNMNNNPEFCAEWQQQVENFVRECETTESDANIAEKAYNSPFTFEEIKKGLSEISNGTAEGADGISNELMKFGGDPMAHSLVVLFNMIWMAEKNPSSWREGLLVNLYKKEDREDPGNYRGITLLSCVGKLFCRILSDRLATELENSGALHEGQAGFRTQRSCADHVFTLSQIVQGQKRESKPTYVFFLDIKKAYDTVWRDGLWYLLWKSGIQGKMWPVIKDLYAHTQSRVLVNGILSNTFKIDQGVAQGCTLSTILFDIFINPLLIEVERLGLGYRCDNIHIPGLLYADDFAGITCEPEKLQELINVVKQFCDKWKLEANVLKSAVMVFNSEAREQSQQWFWGNVEIPVVNQYTYLGVEFCSDGKWDTHIQNLANKAKTKLARMTSLFSCPTIDMEVKRTVFMQAIRPSLEYCAEVWVENTSQEKMLEAIQLGALKQAMGASSKTANEAVRMDFGLASLKSRRDAAKLMFLNKIRDMKDSRYPKILHGKQWKATRPGRQLKCWQKAVSNCKFYWVQCWIGA